MRQENLDGALSGEWVALPDAGDQIFLLWLRATGVRAP